MNPLVFFTNTTAVRYMVLDFCQHNFITVEFTET